MLYTLSLSCIYFMLLHIRHIQCSEFGAVGACRKNPTELQVQCRWQVVHVTIRNNARRAVLYTLSLFCAYFMLLHVRHILCSEFGAVGACRKNPTELQVQCRWQVVHATIRNNARRAVLYTLSFFCAYFMLLHIRYILCSEFGAVGACRKNPTELQVQCRWQVVHATIRNNAPRAVLYTLSFFCAYFMLLHIRHNLCSEFRAVGACVQVSSETWEA